MSPEATDAMLRRWWYYSVELAPGQVTKGIYDPATPLLPRQLLRGVDLAGAECLDIGTMEGLIPTLMVRRGAARVVAVDAVDHCLEKLTAVRQIYGADFGYARVGLMYELSRKLEKLGGYDLINMSGLLYHVFSPLHVIAGARALLKKDGLMIVSTNVVNRNDHTMEWNASGRLQVETNTFWYISIPTLEDFLRLFGLKPIDTLYIPLTKKPGANGLEMETGYMSVICRAAADATPDAWTRRAQAQSWEYQGLLDTTMMDAQPTSQIGYSSPRMKAADAGPGLNLYAAAQDPAHRPPPASCSQDGHELRLSDTF